MTENAGREASLGLSREDFQLFLDSTPDVMFAQQGGVITYVNAAFVRAMRGGGAKEFVGTELIEMIAPEDRERIANQLRDPDPRAVRAAQDVRCIRADKSVATWEYAGFRVGDTANPTSILMCRDVTEQRQQAEALQRAEEDFRLVFDGAPIGVTLTSLAGKYLRANRAMCALVGYTEEELQKLSFIDLTHPDFRAHDVEMIGKLRSGDLKQAAFRKRYLRKDGTSIEIMLTVALLRGRDSEPIGYVSHVLDVTESLRSAAALRLAEEQLRTIFENAPIGMAMASLSANDGRFQRVNPALCKLLGYSEEELLQLDFSKIASERGRAADARYLEEDRARSGQRFTTFKRYRTKDGRLIEAERFLSLTGDAEGTADAAVVQILDITERRNAERALRESEARLRDSQARLSSLIENIGDSMWSLDRQGCITAFNARFASDMLRLYGVNIAPGMCMFDFLPEAERAQAQENHRRSLLGETISLEWSVTVEGRTAHLLLTHNPIISNGEITGASLMSKDITHRRELELEGQRQQRVVTLLQSVAAAANEATSSDVAIEKSLALVAEFTGWPVGHAFRLQEGALVSRGTWYLRDAARMQRFKAEMEPFRFRPGSGLPGRVFSSKEACWMAASPDDPDFPRGPIACCYGLRSGFGFPVLVGDEVVTVVEFFSDRDEPRPSAELVQLMSHVGIQLGRVIERERYAEAVRALSLTDELTGLNNRRGFMVLAGQQLRAIVRSKRPGAVLFADLDGLKRINDTLGHEVGDESIASFGRLLRRTFRDGDIVSRFGGDEFVVFLDSPFAAVDAALTRLAANLRDENLQRPVGAKLAASTGVVEVRHDGGETLEAIVAKADAAMYENKRAKRTATG